MLAVARAAGETAPLILTTSVYANGGINPFAPQAMPNIPVTIFRSPKRPTPTGYARAWGAGLALLAFILLANVGARALLGAAETWR